MLVIFSGDLKHPHGVKQIKQGIRYVNTAFWCKNPFLITTKIDNIIKKYWD
jgi:hypothetical protein